MAPDDYYTEYFDKPIRPTFGDTVERMSWRTMQALDYIFLWENAMKFPLYLQLEDDVQINPGFFDFVISSIDLNSKKNWFSLEFSPLGFIGKLFKSDSLLSLTQYSKLFFDVKPIDWIYWSFIRMKVCSPEWDKKKCQAEVRLAAISCTSKTPFLNHIGSISSLDGKVQHLVERAQGNPETSKIQCSDNIRQADIEIIYSSAKTIEISSNSKPSSMQFNFKHLQSPKQFVFYHGTKLPGKEKSEIDSQIPQNTILYADINDQGWTEIMSFSKCFSSAKSTTIGVQTICKMQGFSKGETIINSFKIVIPAAHPSFLISKIDVKR